ncbi:MAG: VWA domain-containing protein [Acidobacteriota bacterium]|nr:VWA domain-containing protein [Acidobacteriota bacterium]
MNVSRLPRLAFAVLVFAAAGAGSAGAAEYSPVRTGLRAAVDVTAMDLDVVATAKDGRPVTDLTRAEISVAVDGKPVALDYFARVEAGQLHGPDLATASPDLILQTAAAGAERFLPRQFLVFFDDEHLLPFERKRVVEGLRDLVTRLSPSDAMAILSYNVSTHVFVPFTSSKEDLLDGLARLEKTPPRGLHWDIEYRRTIQEARRYSAFSTRGQNARDSLVRNWGAQAWARDKGALGEFRRAVEALGARAGKRVLLYVSHGMELRPGQSLAQALGGTALNQFDYSIQDPYRSVLDAANRAGITIHALDARGLATDVDAGESDPPAIDPFLANANRRELLAGFAGETGGVLVENRNGFGPALDQIYRESASYYAVGVTLASLDAKKPRHEVKVSTSRSGVTVRTRRGYLPFTAVDAARDRMEMSLITPDAGGDFPVTLRTEAPGKGGGLGRRIVPFAVVVPLSSLTFLDENGKKKAVVELILAAVEDNGSRSDPVTDMREIVISPEVLAKSAGEPFVYRGEFKSRTGNMRFVATVRDVATNRIGVGSVSVRVE